MVFILLKSVTVREEEDIFISDNQQLSWSTEHTVFQGGVKFEGEKFLLTTRPNQKLKSDLKNMVPLANISIL